MADSEKRQQLVTRAPGFISEISKINGQVKLLGVFTGTVLSENVTPIILCACKYCE